MNLPARRKPSALPPDLAPEKTQREASDPKTSVWVGASAGSGKTTVLTNRVMRLLLDDVRPQKILCLTFTRAAAAEMANRITKRLGLWATCTTTHCAKTSTHCRASRPCRNSSPPRGGFLRGCFPAPAACASAPFTPSARKFSDAFPIEARLPPHFAVIDETDAQNCWKKCRPICCARRLKHPDTRSAAALAFLVARSRRARLRRCDAEVLSKRVRDWRSLAQGRSAR